MSFEPHPGLLVADRYRLDHVLGEGGMGAVWAARHVATRKPLALKFLKSGGRRSPDVARRFRREARAASAAAHPNLVQVHDVVDHADGTPVLVMELLEGESLERRLARRGRLGLAETVATMLPVLSAVGAAHAAGIVHRDLKPDNIFLARTACGTIVKVLDFGVAKVSLGVEAATADGLTATGALLGTPYYMSPEQALDERDVDARSDVWSMGIILYRCLTGVLPTRGSSLGQILQAILVGRIAPIAEADPSVPADVAALVDRMLSQERPSRPPCCEDVARVLERHAQPGFVLDPPSESPPSDVASSLAPLVTTAQVPPGPGAAGDEGGWSGPARAAAPASPLSRAGAARARGPGVLALVAGAVAIALGSGAAGARLATGPGVELLAPAAVDPPVSSGPGVAPLVDAPGPASPGPTAPSAASAAPPPAASTPLASAPRRSPARAASSSAAPRPAAPRPEPPARRRRYEGID